VAIAIIPNNSIGKGNFAVYEKGQFIERLTGQNPIPENTLLSCQGKCLIKSQGIALVAQDGTKLAIKNQEERFSIYFQKGLVNFVITKDSRKIAFYTPEGAFTVADALFNASSQSSVRGFITVNKKGQTEIGVFQGRMIFTTARGTQVVGANEKIILAVSNVKTTEDEDLDPAGFFANVPPEAIVVGSVIAFAGALYIIDQITDGEDTVIVREVTSTSPNN